MYLVSVFMFPMIFQSTLLQEERLVQNSERKPIYNFNPRSYKRSDVVCHILFLMFCNFNPRSYKRSDIISLEVQTVKTVFQSTLLQEERPGYTIDIENGNDFNPRSYKRSDIKERTYQIAFPEISIHAPTRGATHW